MKFRSNDEMIRIYEAMADNVQANGKPQKIIELGCRNGDGTIALAKALKAKGCVYAILAIDQNEFAITEAKKNEEHKDLHIKYVRKDLDNIDYEKMENADYIFILDRDEYIVPSAFEIMTLQSKCSYLHIIKHPDIARHDPLYKGWYGRMIDSESGKTVANPHDFIYENLINNFLY
jgi:SAM-dependent methyltransferase